MAQGKHGIFRPSQSASEHRPIFSLQPFPLILRSNVLLVLSPHLTRRPFYMLHSDILVPNCLFNHHPCCSSVCVSGVTKGIVVTVALCTSHRSIYLWHLRPLADLQQATSVVSLTSPVMDCGMILTKSCRFGCCSLYPLPPPPPPPPSAQP